MYAAELGRFLTRDPIGYKDSLSFYCYVRCSPITGGDALGLFERIARGDVSLKASPLGFETEWSFKIKAQAKPTAVIQKLATKISVTFDGGTTKHGNTKYYELIEIVDAQEKFDDMVDISAIDTWLYTGLPDLPPSVCKAQIVVTGTVEVLELTSFLKKDLDVWSGLSNIHRFNVGPLETFMSSGGFPSNGEFRRPRGGKNVLESEDEQAKVIVNWNGREGNSLGVQTPSPPKKGTVR